MSIKGVWWLPLFRHSMAHNIFFIANSIGGVILSGRSCVSIFYDPSLLLHVPSFPGIPRTESWRIHRAILALLRRSGRSSGILSSSWRDISYSLPIARGFFRILQDSSGFFRLVRNLLRRFEIEDALGGFQAIDKGFQGSSWILLGFSGILFIMSEILQPVRGFNSDRADSESVPDSGILRDSFASTRISEILRDQPATPQIPRPRIVPSRPRIPPNDRGISSSSRSPSNWILPEKWREGGEKETEGGTRRGEEKGGGRERRGI